MRWQQFGRTIYQTLAWGLLVGVLLAVAALGVSRFSTLEGERVFYLFSPSAQAERAQTLSVKDLRNIRGESARVDGATARELMDRFNAEPLFIEESAGVRSYYCYTDAWTDGVRVGEYYVNLQIAERAEGCVVGAPMIFGGF